MDDKEFQKQVGAKIRFLRKQNGLTQSELGDLCDMEKTGINRIEAGRTNPTLTTLRKIALALGTPIENLFQV